MILTNDRLLKIAQFVYDCKCLCDIGTDHAFIPIYAVENNLAKRAIASDLKTGPLKTAKKNIIGVGLENVISLVQSNGFEAFNRGDFDVAVIAGMGGHLITDILEKKLDIARCCDKIILQPMMDIEYLREWLFLKGFVIIDEALALESKKLYVVLVVKWNETRARSLKTQVESTETQVESTETQKESAETCIKYSLEDLLIGPCLKTGEDPLYKNYITKLINKRKKRLTGLTKSNNFESIETTQAIEAVKEELKTILNWVENG